MPREKPQMAATNTITSAASRPLREGLFRTDPPTLLGSLCTQCGTRVFPARPFCPACDCTDIEPEVELATRGKIYSYTVIHQAPAGRKPPYTLAYVDLTDGVRVMAQVDAPQELLCIDMAVRLDIRAVAEQDGCELIGYVFVPTQEDVQ
ncbi:Zn-ribbon domain-containing OB-fold protein [Pseudomonas aeruginosa]|nr:Zn-ribbon domain-containing OB-fold protein [Pseudomonas aeruginosa]TEO05557.1 Zn-ribbon domain-containing OB-fold protein [Pseudomonas aeruginosa]TEO10251.1 Zn-ribbon domain-containing OB-fold protein [Pseudomonas aeruginosa]